MAGPFRGAVNPDIGAVNPDITVCGLRHIRWHALAPYYFPRRDHTAGPMAGIHEASTLRGGTGRDRSPGWPRRTAVSVERCHS